MNFKQILIGAIFLGTLSFGGVSSLRAEEICEIKISDNFNSPAKIYHCNQSEIEVSKKKVIIPLEEGLTLKLFIDVPTISGGKISERSENSHTGCKDTPSGFTCSFGGGFSSTTTSLISNTGEGEVSIFQREPLEINTSLLWYDVSDYFNRRVIDINIK